MYMFGSGSLYGTPTSGDTTPRKFGVLQEITVEFMSTTKELHGQDAFPVDVARGKASITIKAKSATISAPFFNAIFFGTGVLSTGHNATIELEAAVVPDSPGPYTVTVDEAATFVADLGVVDATTGAVLKRVSAAPASGQYSVSGAGVYTFAAADANRALALSYTHAVVGSGTTLEYLNPKMGAAPVFSTHLYGRYSGKAATLLLPRATASKLSLGFKQEDYALPDFEAKAFAAEGTGQVFSWSFTE